MPPTQAAAQTPPLKLLIEKAREEIARGSRLRCELAQTFNWLDRERGLLARGQRSTTATYSHRFGGPFRDRDVAEVIEMLGKVIKNLRENVDEKRRLLEDRSPWQARWE